jgi:hypothetical protein
MDQPGRLGGGSVKATLAYDLDIPSRWVALAGISIVFVLIGISRSRGAASLAALGISFAVLFLYILPRLGAGQDPLRVIVLGGALIVPPTFYLAHGLSLKTTVAVVGTALSLVLTVVLASLMVAVPLTTLLAAASMQRMRSAFCAAIILTCFLGGNECLCCPRSCLKSGISASAPSYWPQGNRI